MRNDSFETAFEGVRKLAQDFEASKAYYLSPEYQESEVRKDFIDKFLITLGWDVNHETQKNPFQQEVKVERGVAAGQSQRRADYAFYIAPNFSDPRLFVEAKKPFADLCAADNCFQTIRYGWNANVPIAVLTDFKEIAVLDCRYKPDIDTAASAVIERYHYSQYRDTDKFTRIFYLFYRDEVALGSLDRFAQTLPKRRGKAVQRGLFKGGWQPVDESFLEELDQYRDALAHNFKNQNSGLDGETLTEITQRTLDRLVFLRFLEDKLIEPRNYVSEFGDKGNAWIEFVHLCRHLDGIYNGIVFKRHDILDAPAFKVDETQFADLCEVLAHVNSPYDFNFIPIHILGSIYERFLGKVIVVTDKRARVEEKPEVRRAGGVYYTPDYIVRYIVDNTVGKLVAGKTPAQIAEMRFADIACGSGSFLLAIYDLLLRYYRDWYNEHPSKAEKASCMKRDDGYWHLSLKQRREILLNNLYGVDIDSQAIEVAQLSLYLKLLEEETTASTHQYQLEFHETLLPPLNKNIVCGNSLIGTDILHEHLFDPQEERRLNPMDFETAFPRLFARRSSFDPKGNGFDAIVGNPPYVRPHKLQPQVKKYLWTHLRTFVAKADLYSCFMERALGLLKEDGLLAYIVPHTWTSLESFTKIREHLYLNSEVLELVQLPKKVFTEATVETCVFICKRRARSDSKPPNYITVNALDPDTGTRRVRIFPQRDIASAHLFNFQLYSGESTLLLKKKLDSKTKPLSEFVQFAYGFKTADDKKFIHEEPRYKDSKLFIRSAGLGRYYHAPPAEYIWYVPAKMVANRKTARPGDHQRFQSEKIIVARMGKSLAATYDPGGLYVKDAMLLLPMGKIDLRYCLALLNSKLLNWYYREFFITIDVLKNAIVNLPIFFSNLKLHRGAEVYKEIISLVEQMLAAKHQASKAHTDSQHAYFERKCAVIDSQIDELVYELYGLSEDEIKIVEGYTAQDDQ